MSSLPERGRYEDVHEAQTFPPGAPPHAVAMNRKVLAGLLLGGVAGIALMRSGCSRTEDPVDDPQDPRAKLQAPEDPARKPDRALTPQELHERDIAALRGAVEAHLDFIEVVRQKIVEGAPHLLGNDPEESEQLWKKDLRLRQRRLKDDRQSLANIYGGVEPTKDGVLVEIAQPKFGPRVIMRRFMGGEYRLADGTQGKLTPRPVNHLGPTGEFTGGDGFTVFEIPVEHRGKRGTMTVRFESTGMTSTTVDVADPSKPMTVKTGSCTFQYHGIEGTTRTGITHSLSDPPEGPLLLSLTSVIQVNAISGGRPMPEKGYLNLHPRYTYYFKGEPDRLEYTVPDSLTTSQKEFTLSMPTE